MNEKRKERESPAGHRLALDPLAESGSQTVPAFIARPAAAPIYHGSEVLSDVVVADFEIETCGEGDAFVVAPDHRMRALTWLNTIWAANTGLENWCSKITRKQAA
jgi:hypothetical protein